MGTMVNKQDFLQVFQGSGIDATWKIVKNGPRMEQTSEWTLSRI